MQHSDYYKIYMTSPAWQQKREERMEIDDHKCVCCGRPENRTRRGLQVHHITYDRLGDENALTDLCTVCGSCHKKLHNYLSRRKA